MVEISEIPLTFLAPFLPITSIWLAGTGAAPAAPQARRRYVVVVVSLLIRRTTAALHERPDKPLAHSTPYDRTGDSASFIYDAPVQ
jgi:hypothetical protein